MIQLERTALFCGRLKLPDLGFTKKGSGHRVTERPTLTKFDLDYKNE